MITFFRKYRQHIIFWILFLAIALCFAPRQRDFYLDADINQFKSQYFFPTLFWVWGILMLALLLFLIRKSESIKQSFQTFLYVMLMSAGFLFIFNNIFLSAALFINRQIRIGSVTRSYVAGYIIGASKSKQSFYLIDIPEGKFNSGNKLINQVYKPDIKDRDTVVLQFHKGLFGIVFSTQPFDSE